MRTGALIALAALLPPAVHAAAGDPPATTPFGAPAPPGAGAADGNPAATPAPSPRPAEVPDPKVAAGSSRLPAAVAAGCAVWPDDPALLQLEAEREALEMVDHAARLASDDAGRRVAAMHAFIDERNLESRWARYHRGHAATVDQITFDEAVRRARSQAAGAVPTPDTNDIDHLERAVEVEAGVARASWNLLNRQRRTVDALTGFLLSEGLLGDYQGWAPGYMRAMGWNPPRLGDGQSPAPEAVRRRGVQLEWDRAQREQRAERGFAAAPAPPDGSAPKAPPENGTVPAPVALGASPARSVYSNSWWNSYADPYYDTSGFPGRDPDLRTPLADDPRTYGFAPEAYTYTARPMYWELGPSCWPSFGMFPGGMVGGTGFGGAAAGGAVGR